MPKKATPPQGSPNADILRATSLEPAAIREEYATVSSDLAHWGSVRAEAAKQERLAELDTEVWVARYVTDAREKAEAKWERVPGVDGLEKTAKADPEYLRLRGAEIEAAHAKDSAAAVVAAISAKKEMLVSLGADLRQDEEIAIRQRVPK